jgi:hypothetical protein
MKDFHEHDEIDRLIDGLLANPGRVREVKARLRRQVRVVPRAVPAAPDDSADPDEYWDNVPV